MKILIAPDSFKGTLSSLEVIQHVEEIAKQHFSNLQTIKVPIADGGEGTVESIVIAAQGEYREVEVTGPLGEKVRAKYGIINGDTAVIEMAQASGITLVPASQKNPLLATTLGTGEMIKAALDQGLRKITIGIGGSATNDGGIGAVQALGVQFLDNGGNEVGLGGVQLSEIKRISLEGLDARIKDCTITVICDVNNPLTGPKGATAIYGPQKGVTKELFNVLEAGMENYRTIIKDQLGLDMNEMAGAGAAGGLGAALIAFLGAELKPGIETILDIIDFDKLIQGVDLVITGEGKIDGQSAFGKVPVGIAKRCQRVNIPVVTIAGIMGEGAQKTYQYGIDSIMTTINRDMTVEEAMANAQELLRDAVDRMFRFIKVGIKIGDRR